MHILKLLIIVALALSPLAHADGPSEEIFTTGGIQNLHNETDLGGQISYGTCPCFRWTVKVELLGGEIETRDLLISSDALFQFMQTNTLYWNNAELRKFKVGALDALYKGAHIGVGFKGLELGRDYDQSYSDVLRTGFYVLVNLLRTDTLRFDLRTGYDYERIGVNLGPDHTRDVVSETAVLKWKTSRVSATLAGSVFVDTSGAGSGEVGYTGSASIQSKVLRISDFSLGTGFQFSYSHDPFRNLFGLDPNMAVAGVYLDVGYEPLLKKKAK